MTPTPQKKTTAPGTPSKLPIGLPRRPPGLRAGDTAQVIAPAFSFDRQSFEVGTAALERILQIRLTWQNDIFAKESYFAGSDERRAKEFFDALVDPKIKAIFLARGGFGCSTIFPMLHALLANRKTALEPKILVGFSDFTVYLNSFLQNQSWITFHGPVVTDPLLENPDPLELHSLVQLLTRCDRAPDPLEFADTTALHTGEVSGKIVGGCLSLVCASLSTPYEVITDDQILFLEDVTESPYRIERMLTQLGQCGKLDRVKAILFGRFHQCNPLAIAKDPDQTTANAAATRAIRRFDQLKQIPIAFDVAAGHSRPQSTLAFGAEANLRIEKNRVTLRYNEATVS